MMRLQHCADCGAASYPAREVCGVCLSDRLIWQSFDSLPGRVVARTRLYHSNEPRFRAELPLTCGLVHLDSGPVVVCFLADTARPGDAVQVSMGTGDLLHAA